MTLELPDVYTQGKMLVTHDNIPRREELNAWPHLSSVKIPVIDAEVALLIGREWNHGRWYIAMVKDLMLLKHYWAGLFMDH